VGGKPAKQQQPIVCQDKPLTLVGRILLCGEEPNKGSHLRPRLLPWLADQRRPFKNEPGIQDIKYKYNNILHKYINYSIQSVLKTPGPKKYAIYNVVRYNDVSVWGGRPTWQLNPDTNWCIQSTISPAIHQSINQSVKRPIAPAFRVNRGAPVNDESSNKRVSENSRWCVGVWACVAVCVAVVWSASLNASVSKRYLGHWH